MYKLILTDNNNQIQLRLSRSNTIIRTWFGDFANIIYKSVIKKRNVINPVTLNLKKKELHSLFTEITILYQTLIHQYKIDSDLIKANFPAENLIIAQSILLQIRLNTNHLSLYDLQAYFLDEFKCFDFVLFKQTINVMIGKNLIQSIITEDGQQFFDKNPEPHDHLYFKKQKKLVDCSQEISEILSVKKEIKQNGINNSNIFTINKELN